MKTFLCVTIFLLVSGAYAGVQFPVEHTVRLCSEDDPTIFIQNAANEHCLVNTGIPKARKASQVMIDVGAAAWGAPRNPIICSRIVTKKVSALFECVH